MKRPAARWHVLAGTAAAAVATSALGAAPALAAGNFTNGDFASGNYTGTAAAGFETLDAGSATASAMTGWTVTSGSVDWISTYWQQPAGVANSIDMNGTASAAQPDAAGVLSQQFATDVNATYVVQFQLAANPVCGPSTYQVSLAATGATAQPYTVNASGTTSTGNMGWAAANAYSFVATSDTTTLTFAADPGNTSNCGAVIADVTLTETAATGAQCKDGGWQTMFEPNGTPFKNQGDCVSYYATSGQTPIGS